MKLTEMKQIGDEPKVEGGKAAMSFADWLSDMDNHIDAQLAQKLRQVAAHLIKSGFSFGKIPNTLFGNMGFFKGEMIIHLPVKAQSKKAQNKVVVSFGGGSHYDITMAKAARMDYPKLFAAMQQLEAARAEVKKMLS